MEALHRLRVVSQIAASRMCFMTQEGGDHVKLFLAICLSNKLCSPTGQSLQPCTDIQQVQSQKSAGGTPRPPGRWNSTNGGCRPAQEVLRQRTPPGRGNLPPQLVGLRRCRLPSPASALQTATAVRAQHLIPPGRGTAPIGDAVLRRCSQGSDNCPGEAPRPPSWWGYANGGCRPRQELFGATTAWAGCPAPPTGRATSMKTAATCRRSPGSGHHLGGRPDPPSR